MRTSNAKLIASLALIGIILTSSLILLPTRTAAYAATGYRWWVGAKSTDPSALPNLGVRATIDVVAQPGIPGYIIPWVSDDLANNIWIQVGYICNQGAAPYAFYQIWDLNTNTVLKQGFPSITLGFHSFSIYLKTGTTWGIAIDGNEIASYDAGTSVSSSTYPVYSLVEMYNSSPNTFAFNTVDFPTAIEVLKNAGGSWSQVQTAKSYGTAYGVTGQIQDASLALNSIIVGSSVAPLPSGTTLWIVQSSSASTDTISPAIFAPSDMTLQATSSMGAVVTYTVTATDNVAVTSGPTCAPQSGSTFPLGVTKVLCTASDAAGNTGTASFTVTVVDTLPPSTAIISPSNSSIVSASTINVSATAQDNVAIASVQLYLDGNKLAEDFSSPYNFAIDATPLGSGIHTLQTIALDESANRGFSSPVSVQVQTLDNNIDTQAPTISITSPVDNAILPTGALTVKLTSSDNIQVTKVEVYLNSAVKKTYFDPTNWSDFSWNTKISKAGYYAITAVAYDQAGNSSSSTIHIQLIQQSGKGR